jgi:hypothetical protein
MSHHRISQSMGVLIASALLLSLLGGCATGPAFKAPEAAPSELAQIYVFRPFNLHNAYISNKLTVDGSPKTLSLPNASWRRLVVTPGRHTLEVENYLGSIRCGGTAITVSAGQTAYVVNDIRVYGGTSLIFQCFVEQRSEELALKEITGLSDAR